MNFLLINLFSYKSFFFVGLICILLSIEKNRPQQVLFIALVCISKWKHIPMYDVIMYEGSYMSCPSEV